MDINKLKENKDPIVTILYRNSQGELSKQTINRRLKYTNVLLESITHLANVSIDSHREEIDKIAPDITDSDIQKAISELKTSYQKSYDKIINEPDQHAEDSHYVSLGDNIKEHKVDGTLMLEGIVVGKEVIEKGTYDNKPVKSRTNTLIKNYFKDKLTVNKWRTFKSDSIEDICE